MKNNFKLGLFLLLSFSASIFGFANHNLENVTNRTPIIFDINNKETEKYWKQLVENKYPASGFSKTSLQMPYRPIIYPGKTGVTELLDVMSSESYNDYNNTYAKDAKTLTNYQMGNGSSLSFGTDFGLNFNINYGYQFLAPSAGSTQNNPTYDAIAKQSLSSNSNLPNFIGDIKLPSFNQTLNSSEIGANFLSASKANPSSDSGSNFYSSVLMANAFGTSTTAANIINPGNPTTAIPYLVSTISAPGFKGPHFDNTGTIQNSMTLRHAIVLNADSIHYDPSFTILTQSSAILNQSKSALFSTRTAENEDGAYSTQGVISNFADPLTKQYRDNNQNKNPFFTNMNSLLSGYANLSGSADSGGTQTFLPNLDGDQTSEEFFSLLQGTDSDGAHHLYVVNESIGMDKTSEKLIIIQVPDVQANNPNKIAWSGDPTDNTMPAEVKSWWIDKIKFIINYEILVNGLKHDFGKGMSNSNTVVTGINAIKTLLQNAPEYSFSKDRQVLPSGIADPHYKNWSNCQWDQSKPFNSFQQMPWSLKNDDWNNKNNALTSTITLNTKHLPGKADSSSNYQFISYIGPQSYQYIDQYSCNFGLYNMYTSLYLPNGGGANLNKSPSVITNYEDMGLIPNMNNVANANIQGWINKPIENGIQSGEDIFNKYPFDPGVDPSSNSIKLSAIDVIWIVLGSILGVALIVYGSYLLISHHRRK